MSQTIEFFLHPPSPSQSTFECKLPPVSSLLLDEEDVSLPPLSPFMESLSVDTPPQLTSPHASPRSLLLPPPMRARSLSNASTNSTCSIKSLMNDPLEDPPVKRKRGRPPNTTCSPTSRQRDNNWTFVTPTVWDVKHQEIPPKQDEDYMVLHWPTQQGQNTFTNLNMDNTLSIPKKKRGRKPKMELAGNLCFVWRDLTARRGANKKKDVIIK
ncbi:uncharacterized protein EV154DRAFT_223171 [Mucor mucedo]|uniref:uncharacterized protein n=1 Tax=Mucor mucedo TaxID=29922 RepID=UPI00221E74A9|nr:uncharacterized protein EV154DRAFT_223171 [Mucor mucedo]KAI7891378.1 hypothetical protein EV154DRAFT_223171 [Mucor mucedo]